ncbi:PPOX class F420-dependent oxidoreductase [Winogradskya consettensis]|uniref:PPOX class F420-dependent oxidoreductase n=1 Tax=Winogradskya consettensis TaxID=113560 RepID=A0A919SFL6_9ACTN|nr:PPOX class F420-dependent oxidoreductase [Actinoplanes consettensis]GIM70996.1 PPOX class F420-dependent oxidoreductase [Actinoplanes consettensis]
MTVTAEIARSKQVSLTTYRKDGTPVSTPVWQVTEGDTMTIVSEAEAWKVKRIRNNPGVEVTACDIRGRITPGAQPLPGTARLLDDAETRTARDLLARRYVTSRLGNWFSRVLHLKRNPLIGIAITF